MGAFEARLREYEFAEILAANDRGERLILIDGMVLDVKRWLPEHPGGSTIIPQQALNVEAGRFFEVYHSSRESFTFLKHFYVGELKPEDRELVPLPSSKEFGVSEDSEEDDRDDSDDDAAEDGSVGAGVSRR